LETVRSRLAPEAAEAHWLRGLCAYLGGEVEAAVASLREALRLKPEDAQVARTLARIEAEQGRLEAAVDTLRAFCETHPESLEALSQLAELYLRQGALAQAERWYQRLLERQPLAAGPLLKLGLLYHDGHQWERALQYLERVSGEWEAEARFYRAECLRELGRFREARALYEEHLSQREEARAWFGLAQCHLREGDLASALRCARQVLRLSPDHAPAQQMVAALPARLRRQRQRSVPQEDA
jgi:tetratricopeptide (TPR) repeat protein